MIFGFSHVSLDHLFFHHEGVTHEEEPADLIQGFRRSPNIQSLHAVPLISVLTL